jgi:hypothetical protein
VFKGKWNRVFSAGCDLEKSRESGVREFAAEKMPPRPCATGENSIEIKAAMALPEAEPKRWRSDRLKTTI